MNTKRRDRSGVNVVFERDLGRGQFWESTELKIPRLGLEESAGPGGPMPRSE